MALGLLQLPHQGGHLVRPPGEGGSGLSEPLRVPSQGSGSLSNDPTHYHPGSG